MSWGLVLRWKLGDGKNEGMTDSETVFFFSKKMRFFKSITVKLSFRALVFVHFGRIDPFFMLNFLL